jgi:hypothetical protein
MNHEIQVGTLVKTPRFIKRGPIEIGAQTIFKVVSISDDGEYLVGAQMYSPYMELRKKIGYEIGDLALYISEVVPYFSGTSGKILQELLLAGYLETSENPSLRINMSVLEEIITNNIRDHLVSDTVTFSNTFSK